MADLVSGEICIKGNRYRIVDQSAYPAQDSGIGSALDLDLTPAPPGWEYQAPSNEDVGGGQQGGEYIYQQGQDGGGGTTYTGGGTVEDILGKILDAMGAGEIQGGYRSINLTIPARERKYEIRLGLFASQLHIRADNGVTINLNSESAEDIFAEIAEFPFSLSELRKNEAVHTIYITTGANETIVKILAIGLVG